MILITIWHGSLVTQLTELLACILNKECNCESEANPWKSPVMEGLISRKCHRALDWREEGETYVMEQFHGNVLWLTESDSFNPEGIH